MTNLKSVALSLLVLCHFVCLVLCESANINSVSNSKISRLPSKVPEYYFHNSKTSINFNKPSTKFLVKTFNYLQKGLPLTKAVGEKSNKFQIAKSNTIRSFSGRADLQETLKLSMKFTIPSLPEKEQLRKAEIRCRRHRHSSEKNKKYKVRVEVLKGDNIVRKFTLRAKPVVQEEYDIFDITKAVRSSVNGYHGNLSIKLKLPGKYRKKTTDLNRQDLDVMMVMFLENRSFVKDLVTKFPVHHEPVTSHRRRRSTERNNRKWKKLGKKNGCRMYDFDIDFNVLGWGEWIIHPTKFNAKVCHGRCPTPVAPRYNPTNHALLQSLMKDSRQNAAPPLCCVATKLRPLSMMYFEQDEVVVRHTEDMIAEECGCR